MSDKNSSLSSRIEKLRQSFINELPERINSIENSLNQLKSNVNISKDPALVSELHRNVHNLKGTSASFGCTELSQSAIKFETTIKLLSGQKLSSREPLLQKLSDLFAEVKHQVGELTENKTLINPVFPAFSLNDDNNQTKQNKQSKTVFICDDDRLQCETLQSQLSCFSYSTEVFTSQKDLFVALREQVPDAIIVDIMFPESESAGFDCVSHIKNLINKSIPIIFISARDDFEARMQAVRVGGDAYFTKPFKTLDLIDKLDNILCTEEKEAYRVLIVDDDTKVAQYHKLLLKEAAIDAEIIASVDCVLDKLAEFNPDLLLMDYYMPKYNGNELAAMIRQIPKFVGIPIVYLSSETDAAKQFSALRVGADGFLTKPIKPQRLISEVLLRTERMEVIRSVMIRDSLTGLLNHTSILNTLVSSLQLAKRRNSALCFAMVDVDHFKQVNDVHGHSVGDHVLLALSRIFKQRLRNTDAVGRYGGEEFAIIFNDTEIEGAYSILQQLREVFSNIQFSSDSGDFTCSFSGGVVCSTPQQDVHQLINSADKALYQAKKQGRNRILRA